MPRSNPGKRADELLAEEDTRRTDSKIRKLEQGIAQRDAKIRALEKHADKIGIVDGGAKPPRPKPKRRRVKPARHLTRVVVPDSHGEHIDIPARDAFLGDLEKLDVDEFVFLGDHLDCGGTFSSHQRNYTAEMTESFADDVSAANDFLDHIQRRSPNARSRYIYGNHEAHVERWAAREFQSHKDAVMAVDRLGPAAVLELKRREFEWFLPSERYDGLSVPGTIRLGKCHYTHGMSHAKHADAVHLQRVGGNVVFGHVHRAMMMSERNVTHDAYAAWCPGTLAKLQPLYRHTAPTSWQHGYLVQFVNARSGNFVSFQVPIVDGVSLLSDAIDAITPAAGAAA